MSYSSSYIVWQGKQLLPAQLITEDRGLATFHDWRQFDFHKVVPIRIVEEPAGRHHHLGQRPKKSLMPT
jgi:hypothetical protein